MVEGFQRCASSLEKFGGHEYAGGLSLRPEQLAGFTAAFEDAAREALLPEHLEPLLEIDAELGFPEIGMPLMRELDVLQPFGVGNPEPVFITARAEVCERKVFSAGLRYRLRHAGRVVSAVMFGVGADYPGMPGETIDLVYRLSQNEWNGTTSVELRIADLRVASVAADSRVASRLSHYSSVR